MQRLLEEPVYGCRECPVVSCARADVTKLRRTAAAACWQWRGWRGLLVLLAERRFLGCCCPTSAKATEPTLEKACHQTNPPHAHAETPLFSYHLKPPFPTAIASRVRKELSQPQANTLRTPSSRKILSRTQAKTRSSCISAAECEKDHRLLLACSSVNWFQL
jgi:hypothetical protein